MTRQVAPLREETKSNRGRIKGPGARAGIILPQCPPPTSVTLAPTWYTCFVFYTEPVPPPPSDIYEAVADLAHITSEQRATSRGDGNPVYRNRIQFARQSLIGAGFMVGSQDDGWERGVWSLNEAGKRLAESDRWDRLRGTDGPPRHRTA